MYPNPDIGKQTGREVVAPIDASVEACGIRRVQEAELIRITRARALIGKAAGKLVVPID